MKINNLLTCQICGYQAKALHQHIKAVHNITAKKYRKMFGKKCIMQVGFIPPIKEKNLELSKQIKATYNSLTKKLAKIKKLYDINLTRKKLLKNNLWKKYIGKAKWRGFIKDNIILYKSVLHYSKKLDKVLNNVSLENKMKFIIENRKKNFYKCMCGRTYTLNNYCRHCPVDRSNQKGKKHSAKTKRKMRISAIKRIKKKSGQCMPNYNQDACKIFEWLNKEKGWKLQHAENGGEFRVPELGYWVDAIDFKNKIIIEYDEKYHYKAKSLRQCDIKRQVEIEKKYPNFKFIRIKESNYEKKYKI